MSIVPYHNVYWKNVYANANHTICGVFGRMQKSIEAKFIEALSKEKKGTLQEAEDTIQDTI